VTVLPGSAVPVTTVVPVTVEPVPGPVTIGASGAWVSTLKVTVAEGTAPLTLSVALTVWLPSESGVGGTKVQLPLASATVVPTCTPSMKTWTVAPGCAVPWIAGVAVFSVAPSLGAVIVGCTAVGATLKVVVAEGTLMFPAESVAVAEAVCEPVESGVVGVKVQCPLASAVAVPTTVPSMVTVTVAPGAAVPLISGVALDCVEPSVGVTITGALGAVVSTAKWLGSEGELVPAAVVSVAVTVYAPSGRLCVAGML
jgi:hypothetical protein